MNSNLNKWSQKLKTNNSGRGKVVKNQMWAMHKENIRVIKAGNGTARTQQRQLSLIFLCFYTLDRKHDEEARNENSNVILYNKYKQVI